MSAAKKEELGRLVLGRRVSESFNIDENIEVTVMAIIGKQVRIRIRAPKNVIITRDNKNKKG